MTMRFVQRIAGQETMIYDKELTALGFSTTEIGAIEWVLLRMGVIPTCEHTRPRFVECYSLDEDPAINDARWKKGMQEMGFRADAIALAESATFGECKLGTA
jgi:hypothetical protein